MTFYETPPSENRTCPLLRRPMSRILDLELSAPHSGHNIRQPPPQIRCQRQPGGSLPFLLLHAIVKTFEKEFAGRYLPVRAVSSAQYCREMVLELQLPAP